MSYQADHYLAGEAVECTRDLFIETIVSKTHLIGDTMYLVYVNHELDKNFLVYAKQISDALEYIRDFLNLELLEDYQVHEVKL